MVESLVMSAEVRCFSRWMTVTFPQPYRCVSWAVINGGIAATDTVAWLFLEIDEIETQSCHRFFYQLKQLHAILRIHPACADQHPRHKLFNKKKMGICPSSYYSRELLISHGNPAACAVC